MTADTYDASVDANGITTGAWGTAFCSCFDALVPNCLMVTFCPWVSFAQVTSRMGIAPYSKTLLLFLGLYIVLIILEILSPHSIIFTVLMLPIIAFYIFSVWQLRGRVRQRFEIPGSQCEDLLLSWCCGCCVMAQMATHVKSYQPGNCNFGPVDSLPPYNPGACMPAVPLRGSCLSFEL